MFQRLIRILMMHENIRKFSEAPSPEQLKRLALEKKQEWLRSLNKKRF